MACWCCGTVPSENRGDGWEQGIKWEIRRGKGILRHSSQKFLVSSKQGGVSRKTPGVLRSNGELEEVISLPVDVIAKLDLHTHRVEGKRIGFEKRLSCKCTVTSAQLVLGLLDSLTQRQIVLPGLPFL